MFLKFYIPAFIVLSAVSLHAMEDNPEKVAQMLFRTMSSDTSLDSYDLASLRQSRDLLDNTLLIKAASSGNEKAVAALLNSGFSIDHPNSAGQTALMRAVTNSHFKVAEILCDAKANVNARDFFGRTALMMAVENNDVHMVRLLLIHGAEREIESTAGETAHQIASRVGFTEVLETLDTSPWYFLLEDFFGQEAYQDVPMVDAQDESQQVEALSPSNTQIESFRLTFTDDGLVPTHSFW